jgi:hypothetical protein
VRRERLSLRPRNQGDMKSVGKERDVRIRKDNCTHKAIHKQYRHDVSDSSSPAHEWASIVRVVASFDASCPFALW